METEAKETALETVGDGTMETGLATAGKAEMEFRLINPTEDGFLRKIKWNREEIEEAVRQKTDAYRNVVYTEDSMKQAKADRAELNKLSKAIEDRRKMVKRKVNEPYEEFEKEVKEILALIKEPVDIIDGQIREFEDRQKEEKKGRIRTAYDEAIGDLSSVLPFEKVFDPRYLNSTYALGKAQDEVKEKVERVRTDLDTIDGLDSKYKLNAKDVYIRTLDLSKAMAENRRLTELEEKLEAEKRRKEEKEAERRRLAKERRKAKEAETDAENAKIPPESVAEQPESVVEQPESVAKPEEPERQGTDGAAVSESSGAPQTESTQAVAEAEKKYSTSFRAVGTKKQLQGLVTYMEQNGIKYGRI